MSVYVEMRTDGFRRNLDALAERSAYDFDGVRRPLRGIEIKDDTHSILKVIRSNGDEIPLVDAGARGQKSYSRRNVPGTDLPALLAADGTTFNYSNFIAQEIVDARAEKQQVVETFGEPFIFFYGEKPRILGVRGMLMNTLDFNWKNEFWKNYERYLRGTKLVELDARIYFYFDDQVVEGYMLDAQASHQSDSPYHVPFQFTLFVTAHSYVDISAEDGMYPVSANVDIPVESLRATENINEIIKTLRIRKDSLRPDELISTTQDVYLASLRARGGVVGKDAIMSAVIRGMSDYEARVTAFFDNIKTYFYGRRMVVPQGVAGAEEYAGLPTHANQAVFQGTPPKRTLPLRSKIADNVDEYIGNADMKGERGAMEDLLDKNEMGDAEYELLCLQQLQRLGVDITDNNPAQSWRTKFTHSITKTAGRVDFTAGIATGVISTLATKTRQAYDLAQSMPSLVTDTVRKTAIPFYIP